MVKTRTDRKSINLFLIDWISYVAPVIIPTLLAIYLIDFGLEYDYYDFYKFLSDHEGSSAAHYYYCSVILVVLQMFMPFFATLRDRKLITKGWEMSGVLVLSCGVILTTANMAPYPVVHPLSTISNLF